MQLTKPCEDFLVENYIAKSTNLGVLKNDSTDISTLAKNRKLKFPLVLLDTMDYFNDNYFTCYFSETKVVWVQDKLGNTFYIDLDLKGSVYSFILYLNNIYYEFLYSRYYVTKMLDTVGHCETDNSDRLVSQEKIRDFKVNIIPLFFYDSLGLCKISIPNRIYTMEDEKVKDWCTSLFEKYRDISIENKIKYYTCYENNTNFEHDIEVII